MSLTSLGLSKDPKDAQRQPYRFPDVDIVSVKDICWIPQDPCSAG
jgi:hypothetical protein